MVVWGVRRACSFVAERAFEDSAVFGCQGCEALDVSTPLMSDVLEMRGIEKEGCNVGGIAWMGGFCVFGVLGYVDVTSV